MPYIGEAARFYEDGKGVPLAAIVLHICDDAKLLSFRRGQNRVHLAVLDFDTGGRGSVLMRLEQQIPWAPKDEQKLGELEGYSYAESAI